MKNIILTSLFLILVSGFYSCTKDSFGVDPDMDKIPLPKDTLIYVDTTSIWVDSNNDTIYELSIDTIFVIVDHQSKTIFDTTHTTRYDTLKYNRPHVGLPLISTRASVMSFEAIISRDDSWVQKEKWNIVEESIYAELDTNGRYPKLTLKFKFDANCDYYSKINNYTKVRYYALEGEIKNFNFFGESALPLKGSKNSNHWSIVTLENTKTEEEEILEGMHSPLHLIIDKDNFKDNSNKIEIPLELSSTLYNNQKDIYYKLIVYIKLVFSKK